MRENGPLVQIGNLVIRVYANDHLPPHFHVITPDADALVDIGSLEVIKGKLPPKALKVAMGWAEENKALIAAEWNRTNPRFPVA
jgi:hypothetical protein